MKKYRIIISANDQDEPIVKISGNWFIVLSTLLLFKHSQFEDFFITIIKLPTNETTQVSGAQP